MKKILVITGSRAEYGILRSTIDAIRASRSLELRLLATGMHTLSRHGLTVNEIKKDKIPLAAVVKIGQNDDMLTSLAKEIAGIRKYCLKERPDLIVVLGDRDEPFAGAIVGGHFKIPVAHIHGGDVTGYVVDEYIRHAITKFSHLHFTASAKSYRRVLQLGEEPARVFNVGAPGLDRIRQINFLDKPKLAKKYNLNPRKKWFLVVHHPTSLDKVHFKQQIGPLFRALGGESAAEKVIILPNSDAGADVFFKEMKAYESKTDFHFYKNIPRDDYLNFLATADLLIGNSSSGIIEAGYFKLPVINIGNRQKGRECGKNVLHIGYGYNSIKTTLNKALSLKFHQVCRRSKHPYGRGLAGKKIVGIIEKKINDPALFYKKFTYA